MTKHSLIKRFFAAALLFAVMATSAGVTVGAAQHSPSLPYSWYFKTNTEHKPPELPDELSFIKNCSGWYLDETASDSDKVIYLTFDAGYDNGNIGKILDSLKAHSAKAAFFVLSNLVERNTDLVKRMTDEGHLVCNHTSKHPDMTRKHSLDSFGTELKKLEDVYAEYTGLTISKFYRPPQGVFSEENLLFAEQLGYKTVFWSYAYADWDNNNQMSADKAFEKVISHTHNGMVLLLHPTSATNAAIMDRLLDEWENQGYRFGTLDELVENGAKCP